MFIDKNFQGKINEMKILDEQQQKTEKVKTVISKVGIDQLSAPISGILTHIGISRFLLRQPIRDQFKTGLFWL